MEEYEVRSIYGHFELWVNGEFYCSCDTLTEAYQEIKSLQEETA